jgi:hypothetical protein
VDGTGNCNSLRPTSDSQPEPQSRDTDTFDEPKPSDSEASDSEDKNIVETVKSEILDLARAPERAVRLARGG